MSSTVLPPKSDELDGVWASAGFFYGDEVHDNGDIRNGRLTIAGGVATVWNATRSGYAYRVRVVLRPQCSPKEIDSTQVTGDGRPPVIFGTVAGIYELDGDRLAICTNGAASSAGIRPTHFAAEHGIVRFTKIRTGETQ